MNVSYELSEDDQLEFNRFVQGIGRTNVRRRLIGLRVYGIFATSFGIFLTIWMSVSAEIFRLGLLCIFLGLFVGLMPEWSVAIWTRRMKAMFRKPEFQKYRGTRTTTIETTGLRVVGPSGERLLLWDGLAHSPTGTLDIFHLAPADAIVIPRRAFTSDAHRQTFLDAIETAKTGAGAPTIAQAQTWWTQSGVTEAEAQNVQRGG